MRLLSMMVFDGIPLGFELTKTPPTLRRGVTPSAPIPIRFPEIKVAVAVAPTLTPMPKR
jgi:hypothetical protein